MGKYIDGSGLSHFMGIIKGALATKAPLASPSLTGTPTAPTASAGTDSAQVATTAFVQAAIGAIDSGVVSVAGKTGAVTLVKADVSDLAAVTTTEGETGLMTAADKSKLNGIAAGAEVNQNAFANVKVGTTTIAADGKTDTLELAAGSNVTLTPDATGDKVTIAATDTTYSDATTSASGLMSASDKTKLNGIASGAEANQSAFANVKVGSSTVAADAVSDTLELAGSNVTLTPDATNDKVTIGITASNVTTALGNTAVARATGDASGNAISSTYAPLASPALTGTPTAPTAAAGTSTTQVATTAFVANAVGTATAGALQYKGTVASESTITGAAYKKGWYYVVSTAGTYLGKACEVGDMLIAKQDKTSTPANDWDAVQSNIEVLSNSEIDALWAAA